MKKPLCFLFTVLLFIVGLNGRSQTYFPPSGTSSWDTVSPASLGWCTDQLDSLSIFLDTTDTKAFIILKNGRIAFERYFNGHFETSLWYWASAGKTVTGFLVGCAQEDGYLNILDKTSDYLGKGWTSLSPSREDSITIRHQLTMTSGLNDQFADPDCLVDTCLDYLAPAGSRWAYHNAPYRLLQDVVDSSMIMNYQLYTQLRLKDRIGMSSGLWLNYVFWSRARDMARFGLLMENEGILNGDTVMSDGNYFYDLIHPSQNLNKSYGYLFWLNGQSSFMLPQSQFVFPGPLLPLAPPSMYAGLGKNDQKLYVLPDHDMVIIRMGNPGSGGSQSVPILYDVELWKQLNKVFCGTVGLEEGHLKSSSGHFYPNPALNELWFEGRNSPAEVRITNAMGLEWNVLVEGDKLDVTFLRSGVYIIQWSESGFPRSQRIVKRSE